MEKRIENFLKNLSFEQLNEVRNLVSNLIYSYDDGYRYECKVRSYGRSWTEHHANPQCVQDLCYRYDGDDGIIDVYTTNPDLKIDTYGNAYYFPTLEDAETWRNKRYLESWIPQWEKELAAWDNRDSVPFRERPSFAPFHDQESIDQCKEELALLSNVIEPVRLVNTQDETDIL